MLASYPHCNFRVLHCTNQYTVSLKMFAQGGIVTLNSINHLSPLLINANCEKKNENRIPHRFTQSMDSEEKDIAMTVWNKHKSLGFLLSKQSYCMYPT